MLPSSVESSETAACESQISSARLHKITGGDELAKRAEGKYTIAEGNGEQSRRCQRLKRRTKDEHGQQQTGSDHQDL